MHRRGRNMCVCNFRSLTCSYIGHVVIFVSWERFPTVCQFRVAFSANDGDYQHASRVEEKVPFWSSQLVLRFRIRQIPNVVLASRVLGWQCLCVAPRQRCFRVPLAHGFGFLPALHGHGRTSDSKHLDTIEVYHYKLMWANRLVDSISRKSSSAIAILLSTAAFGNEKCVA
jgi:hypothetical protein